MRDEPPLALTVSELFYSIQGESSRAGLPCLFIRLSGCNLRCSYCDARYTYEEPGTSTTLEQILRFTGRWPGVMVEVTGGEPLLQKNVIPLMEKLRQEGRTVLLETNGSRDIAVVPDGVVRIVDIKCPGSGMAGHFRTENLRHMDRKDEIKFVITSRSDYQWAKAQIEKHRLAELVGPGNLLISPVPERLDPAAAAGWLLEDNLQARLQLQLHKLLWPGRNRGA